MWLLGNSRTKITNGIFTLDLPCRAVTTLRHRWRRCSCGCHQRNSRPRPPRTHRCGWRGLRVTKKALAQKEDEGRMTHIEIRTAPRQVVSGSVKQCPLWAYLASQSLCVKQDAELRYPQDETRVEMQRTNNSNPSRAGTYSANAEYRCDKRPLPNFNK